MLFAEPEFFHKVPYAEGRNVLKLRPRVRTLGIFVIAQRRHTYFLSLINKLRTAEEGIHNSKTFSAFHAVFFTAVARNRTRLVVTFQIVYVPGSAKQLSLPVVIRLFQLFEAEGQMHPGYDYAVRLHMLKANHHIQLFLVFVYVL